MKRILLFLAIVLSAWIVKAEKFEYNGLIYEIFETTNDIMNQNESALSVKEPATNIKGAVTIPAYVYYNGKELPVRRIDALAFRNCEQLTEITFPNTLKKIGFDSFSNTGIKTLDLSSLRVDISEFAFSLCKNLSEVKLPTSGSVAYGAFSGCNAIKSLMVPPNCYLYGLPPKLEDLYIVYWNWLGGSDLSNVTLHVPKNRMEYALDAFGDKCKNFQIWDFEVIDDIIPDLNSFESEFCPIEDSYVFYTTIGQPTRLAFQATPENTLFKSIYISKINHTADFNVEYDGEDAVIFTLNRIDPDTYYQHKPLKLFSVNPHLCNGNVSYDVYVYQKKASNYPTSIGFEYPQVNIQPSELYYQPVLFYPEGSTLLPIIWTSSDPNIVTVTKDGKVYPLVEEGIVAITATTNDGFNEHLEASYTAIIGNNSAIDDIFTNKDTQAVYYNLQGIKVAEENLTSGIYIVKRNGKTQKVVVP